MALTKIRQEQGVVINDGSTDVDFRVESNGNANMLVIDGGDDVMSIGAAKSTSATVKIQNKDDGREEETIKPKLIMLPPLRLPVPETGQVVASDLINHLKNVIRNYGSLKNIDNIFVQNSLYKYLKKHLPQNSEQYIIASPIIAYSKSNNYLDFWSKMNKIIKNDEVLKKIEKALKMDTLNYIECKTEKGHI
jgi:hypothetical protein